MLFAQTEAPTKRNANKVVMKLINDGLAAGCSISKSENVFAYNNKLNYNTGYVISIYSSCDDIDALRNAIAEVNLKKNFVFWANPVINDEQTEEWANQKIDYQSKPFSHFEEFNKNKHSNNYRGGGSMSNSHAGCVTVISLFITAAILSVFNLDGIVLVIAFVLVVSIVAAIVSAFFE